MTTASRPAPSSHMAPTSHSAPSIDMAPWLHGLSDAWVVAEPEPAPANISSATHDAHAIGAGSARVMRRRSQQTAPPTAASHQTAAQHTAASHRTASHASTHRRRTPLATLTSSDSNLIRLQRRSSRTAASQSFSAASDQSVLQAAGTVAQRSKSASPAKTLEWRRRLLKGEVGYGDQTDLFGAHGLENIFAAQKPAPDKQPNVPSRVGWLNGSSVADLPSSPPPWPRHHQSEQDQSDRDGSDQDGSDQDRSHPAPAPHQSDPPLVEGSFQGESAIVSPERLEPTEHGVVGNRTVSGPTECEDFSPVFISKHTTADGKTDYKPFDSHYIKSFQHMGLRRPSPSPSDRQDHPPCPDEPVEPHEESASPNGPESHLLHIPSAAPDLSLSENLPTGTPPSVANLGGNVGLRRGGYSAQGSWRERLLSASQSSAEPAPVRQASRLRPPMPSSRPNRDAPSSRLGPSTPVQQHRPSEPRSRSSGSPLKLFGPHDTFTSNRLLRRMSQLDPGPPSLSEEQQESTPKRDARQAEPKVSGASFGSGHLSHHQFHADITITSASDSDQQDSDRSPPSDVPPPGARTPVIFNLNTSPITKDNTFTLRRSRSARASAASALNLARTERQGPQQAVEDPTDLSVIVAAGKRARNSPYKAPTPKRRRTLHASEIDAGAADSNRSYHNSLQDALETRQATSHKIDRLQEALRPRNPTPSQRRREQIQAEIRETAEQFAAEEPERLEAVLEQLESSVATASPPSLHQQARTVAHEVAKFSLRIQKASADMTERKRSVTTQDFFNEAVMVMRLIREKAVRQSGLGSVAESGLEGNSGFEGSNPDPSALRISRPPSRDVASGWRSRNSEHTDARVASHLRRYRENDDTEFIAQSVASLHVQEEVDGAGEGVFDGFDDGVLAVDEQSVIRIRGPMPITHGEGNDSRPTSQRSCQTQSTQRSSATSTGRTLHTTSTRRSENVGTLAPDAVAHLIGEQVGSMQFDKGKQQWVKARSAHQPQSYGRFLEPPSNITSDDDPFREISDLPVDEREEEEVRKTSGQGRRLGGLPPDEATASVPGPRERAEEQQAETRTASQETVLAQTVTSESRRSRHADSSSDPSRCCTNTAFGSSQRQVNETRATSWGADDLHRLAAQGKARHQPLAYAAAQAALQQHSRHTSTLRRPQSVDTQKSFFPAPETIAEERESMFEDGEETDVGDETLEEVNGHSEDTQEHTAPAHDLQQQQRRQQHISALKLRKDGAHGPAASSYRKTTTPNTRPVSLRRPTFTRPFTKQDENEQSELSFVAPLPGDRLMSISLSVSRPLGKPMPTRQVAELLPSSPIKFDPSHILSDLPDFTVHEEDHERPTERALAQRLAKHAADEVNDRYALTVKDLVNTLTDVTHGEPCWEKTTHLEVPPRSVRSIYGLKDFCGAVQEMNISGNEISYLDGAPGTVRTLVARNCLLSSLTPWTHLVNLQYLDISGNQLDNVTGLDGLIHLRELRADDNNITSLDGVLGLDGLLKLRVRRNQLRHVNLDYSSWHRLEELDLCGNQISCVQGLDTVARLGTLKLDGNHLTTALDHKRETALLKHLSLRDCGLRQLDVTRLPALRTLLVDRNRLTTVLGVQNCRHLDLLSMRSQALKAQTQRLQILETTLHARTVRLSGNNIRSLELSDSLLSLQHLELASAGLQTLPDDFGLKMPNLISLNLNFNSLKDIRPLLNSQKLEKLTVCGNRIARMRKSIATLSKIPSIQEFDMRDNVLTQGFYAPNTATAPATIHTSLVRRQRTAQPDPPDDEDTVHEEMELAKYTQPPQPSQELDTLHHDRLDETTKLRRRVCHLMLGHSCPSLKLVDGRTFAKNDALVKDRTWDRLIELGIMRKSGEMALGNGSESP